MIRTFDMLPSTAIAAIQTWMMLATNRQIECKQYKKLSYSRQHAGISKLFATC
jgi:hypothetical protein